jgi:hypothetical protein
MVQLREMDTTVSYAHQLQDEQDEPIVLINQFNVAPEETESFLDAWTDDAAFTRTTRLHLDPTTSRNRRQQHVHERRCVGIAASPRQRLRLTRIAATRRPVSP